MSNDNQVPRRPRGKPLGYRKPDPLCVTFKIRCKPKDLEVIIIAASKAGEKISAYIRTAALQRAAAQAQGILATSNENPTDQPGRGDE
jgi:hypothetical protein